MSKALNKIIGAVALAITLSAPTYAAGVIDLTQMFNQSTRELADGERISRGEENVRLGRAFADVKPVEVGDQASFNTYNLEQNCNEKIKATCKKIGKHCYVYLQNGKKVEQKTIDKIANAFDNKIYPTDRAMFGNEWTPGIDDDARITLLLLDIKDGYNPSSGNYAYTGGYFNAGDCYTKSKYSTSNEKEMLYLDINPSDPNSDKFLSVMAHEFQHMIHWNHDPKEYTWLNESMSQLAPYLCGYGHPSQVDAFLRTPDNNMCAWSDDDMVANYGQVYMWAQYISTRIASTDERRQAFIRRMVAQKSQGMAGINDAIEKQGIKNSARNLFRNFCVANYLNDDRINNGDYGYGNALSRFYLNPEIKVDKAPAKGKSSVKCWSAKCIKINPATIKGKKVAVCFAGQKIATTELKNAFDVALVHYCSDGKVLPKVNWLPVKDYKVNQEVTIPAEYDRMLMVVVNRGPETMKSEQAFAKNAGSANFTFAIGATGAAGTNQNITVAANKSTTKKSTSNKTKSKTTTKQKANAARKSIMTEILANVDKTNASSAKLGKGSEAEQQESAVEYELATQRLIYVERLFLAMVKKEIANDSGEIAREFITFYVNSPKARKVCLCGIMRSLKEVLRFEKLQGSAIAADLLDMIEADEADEASNE